MLQSIYPIKDSTIYEQFPAKNTGIDSILEINKTIDNILPIAIYNSRILIKYDTSEIKNIINKIPSIFTSSIKYYLNLYTAEMYEIPTAYTLYAYPVSGSWNMGTGKYENTPETTEGVSWKYKEGYLSNTQWATSSFNIGTTGSYVSEPGGANWFVNYVASQSFDYEITDIRMNVTNIVDTWINNTIPNEGFILKRSNDDESSLNTIGEFQFFSMDTHTIYPPKLEITWNDFSFITGSTTYYTTSSRVMTYSEIGYQTSSIIPLPSIENSIVNRIGSPTWVSASGQIQWTKAWDPSVTETITYYYATGSQNFSVTSSYSLPALTAENIILYLKDTKAQYNQYAEERIRVVGREKFITKTYATRSAYLDVKYLPTSSYYSIKDASSEDIIIPFDTCTQISCDSSGNFFDVNFDGLQPERNYRFLFKIERGQNKEFFDNNYYFKVVRNSKIPN